MLKSYNSKLNDHFSKIVDIILSQLSVFPWLIHPQNVCKITVLENKSCSINEICFVSLLCHKKDFRLIFNNNNNNNIDLFNERHRSTFDSKPKNVCDCRGYAEVNHAEVNTQRLTTRYYSW